MLGTLIRRLDVSLAVALAFLLVVAAVAVLTTNRELEAVILGALVIVAAAATWFLRRAIVEDLRTRAETEAALQESEGRFAGILAIAADAIVTIDQTGRIVHFNQGAETLFGYAAAEMIGQPLDVLLPARYVDAHRHHVETFAASDQVARHKTERRDVTGRRRNGEEFVAEASISKLPTSTGALLTAVVRDVTAQRQRQHHEHILAVAGARLAATLDYGEALRLAAELPIRAAGDWSLVDVVESDSSGKRTLRRTASTDTEADRDRALRSIEVRGIDGDSPADAVDVLRTGKARFHRVVSEDWIESHAIDDSELADIRQLGIRSSATVPLRAGDRLIGALTVGTSVRRMTDADFELTSALAERIALALENAALYRRVQRALVGREQVLAVVSHDLRTPATAIAMCARTLLEHPPDDPAEVRALQSTILEASNWMHRLMQDLLDAASIDAGRFGLELAECAIGPIIASAIELFVEPARVAGITLRASILDDLPRVRADPDRIIQLTGNLLSNALRFTPVGGTVSVAAEASATGVVIRVTDTGGGIEPEHLPHLFDRFWHAESLGVARGTGLGLAIAKGIAEAHGGRVWATSTLGQGSSFYVELPTAQR